jgi:hypothetical protein
VIGEQLVEQWIDETRQVLWHDGNPIVIQHVSYYRFSTSASAYIARHIPAGDGGSAGGQQAATSIRRAYRFDWRRLVCAY